MKDVLIIGGGIAGTATALAMHKAGMHPRVFEAYPSGGDDAGAFLTVGANGMRALDQLGAREPVTGAGFPLRALRVLSGADTELARIPIADHHQLLRSALYRALHEQARMHGIELYHGKRLHTVREFDDGVEACFTDGSTERAELLIGADGVRSVVRPLIDPQAPAPRYAGERVYYGYTDSPTVTADPDVLTVSLSGPASFGYTVSPDGETWWFCRVRDEPLTAPTSPEAAREYLLPLFDADTPAATIVLATGERLLAANSYDLRDMPHWHRGRLIVVGDAAHVASPASAQGASLALEDAVMLTKSLRDNTFTEEALQVYRLLRRARVNRIIDGGAAQATAKPRRGEPAEPARARPSSKPDPQRWLHEYPIEWNVTTDIELATSVDAAQKL